MINSVLNLCRVCPVPTEDKVNSEYKQNFTWRDSYQTGKPDIIKQAPSASSTTLEPALPRKKKNPELAYKAHEFFHFDCEEGDSSDSLDTMTSDDSKGDQELRARSEERTKSRPTLRSRSADPNIGRKRQKHNLPPTQSQNPEKSDTKPTNPKSEYRSQFAWPKSGSDMVHAVARKSASMGMIAAECATKELEVISANGTPKAIQPPRTLELGTDLDLQDDDAILEALKRKRIKKTEYKSKFRPFSSYVYIDGGWKKAEKDEVKAEVDPNAWYSEVAERLKKADEYRWRSHGGPLLGEKSSPYLPEFSNQDRCSTFSISPVIASRSPTRSKSAEKKKKSDSSKKTPEGKHVRPKSIALDTKPREKISNGPVEQKKSKFQTDGDESTQESDPLLPEKESPTKELKTGEGKKSDAAARPQTLPNMTDTENLVNGICSPSPPVLRPKLPNRPVPLTTVKSPEEVTGVRSPDPATWTVPLETGKGLQWTDGKTPSLFRWCLYRR
ncbi:nuclear protein MDM1-like isoform X2 [Centruroides sculpturatus]|uniref:nuclear protein MDM1-like isoform X2 n=1 Tax=Centruroides sculpturatus TaxID=218467 RepID=UPI000C6C93E7|nr:nuclear protein MDM1-like isoform X2 [Centruroides sculpturatus]